MLAEILTQARRILVVRLDNIGDVVMTGPALRALNENLPQAQITLLASPAGSKAAPLLPWVDDVITWSAMWQDISPDGSTDVQREAELVDRLRAGHYDAALIFTSFSQSPHPPGYVCYLAGIPVRVGQSKEFGGAALSHWFRPPADEGHQVDRNLALLESAGFRVGDQSLELHIPTSARENAMDLLEEAGIERGEPYIVLAPGASASARRYPPERYAEVALGLQEATGLRTVLAGSEREMETLTPALETAGRNGVVSLVGRTELAEFAALVEGAKLALGNNSAVLHFADAFHTPMVILYSGTDCESQWAPRKAPFRLLRRSTSCSPCYLFTCPYSKECLDFHPGAVLDAVSDLWDEVGAQENIDDLRAMAPTTSRFERGVHDGVHP